MSVASKTPSLDRLGRPAGLRNLSTEYLKELSIEQLKELAADSGLKVRPMTLPEHLIDHDSHPRLTAPEIVNAVLGALDRRDLRQKSTLASSS